MSEFLRTQNFKQLGNGVAVLASTSSQPTQFPTITLPPLGASATLVTNSGANPVSIAFGQDNTILATFPTAGVPAIGYVVLPSQTVVLDKKYCTWFNVLTTTGTSLIYVYQGEGN